MAAVVIVPDNGEVIMTAAQEESTGVQQSGARRFGRFRRYLLGMCALGVAIVFFALWRYGIVPPFRATSETPQVLSTPEMATSEAEQPDTGQ
ncbi:MAG: hypothetical protein BWK76_04145 [Desulfobulbaceae bacterium A2]|nr:MAG: hypothetical protein BWK76_04145 [Desulfobulbaceae bacterium A2]